MTDSSQIEVSELTTGVVNGTGVFDQLMKAFHAHIDGEFKQGRIKGTEYSTVYLGGVEAAMRSSVDFLFQRHKNLKEADLIQAQIDLAKAQASFANQQKANLVLEGNILVVKEANAKLEGKVLVATECKLRAEYDLTQASTLKTKEEMALLVQKTATEKAQTIELGVDSNSIIGRQKNLYQAQTEGFTRDAEQKAAKLLVDTWNVRRTTDEGTSANTTNMLDDATVGRTIQKLLAGVKA